jgi:hypothetical protein
MSIETEKERLRDFLVEQTAARGEQAACQGAP